MAHARTARRRLGAIQMARAKISRTMITMKFATAFRARTPCCARESSLERSSTIWPAFGPSLALMRSATPGLLASAALARLTMPAFPPTCCRIWRRSSVTLPPLVRRAPLSSSTKAISLRSACLVGAAPGLLHPRACERTLREARGRVLQARGRRSGQRLRPLRQRGADLGGHVDVGIELVDEVGRKRLAYDLVLEHLAARVAPGPRLERDPLHPHGKRTEDEQQRGEDHQSPHAVQPATRFPRLLLALRSCADGRLARRSRFSFCLHRCVVAHARDRRITPGGRERPEQVAAHPRRVTLRQLRLTMLMWCQAVTRSASRDGSPKR